MHLSARLALSFLLGLTGVAFVSAPASQAAPTITISPPSVPTAVGGKPYSLTFAGAGGTAPYYLSLRYGSIPPGMALSSSGQFSGSPTKTATMPASYTFGIRLTDAQNYYADREYTITVVAPTITISPATISNQVIGQSFSHDLGATGGTGTYSYSLRAGALPPGVALSSLGRLYGTPGTLGSYNFTVAAIDDYGFVGTRTYDFDVQDPPPSLTSSAPLTPVLNSAYQHILTVAGSNAPYRFVLVSGALPTGLRLSPDGVVSGTPTVPGGFRAIIETVSTTKPTAPLSIPVYLAVAPRLAAKLSPTKQRRGRLVRVTGSGLVPGTRIVFDMDGTKRLGATKARSDGTFSMRVRIPKKAKPGGHRIVVKAAGMKVSRPVRVAR